MRFHLLMLLVVILVSLGMHGLASAMPTGGPQVPGPAPSQQGGHGS